MADDRTTDIWRQLTTLVFLIAALAGPLLVLDARSAAAEAQPRSVFAVDIEYAPGEDGYWIVTNSGVVFSFGDATHFGSAFDFEIHEQVVSMSATPSGDGYWLFTDLGRVFAFGGAPHLGDLSGMTLDGAVIDSVATPTGLGYYMVAEDGGVFAFGDAEFAGSMGGIALDAPVVGLAPDSDNQGYWLVAADGGMFAFDAPFHGSIPQVLPAGGSLNQPVIAMLPQSAGYLLLGRDGGIFNFGQSVFHGSLGADGFVDVSAVAVRADRSGYVMVRESGDVYTFGSATNLGEPDLGRHLADCRPALEGHANETSEIELLRTAVLDVIGPCTGRPVSFTGQCPPSPSPADGEYCFGLILRASSGDSWVLVSGPDTDCYQLVVDERSGRHEIIGAALGTDVFTGPTDVLPTCGR